MPYPTKESSEAEVGFTGNAFLTGGGTVPFGTNYNITATSYVSIDGNLAWQQVIPPGFNLIVSANGVASVGTSASATVTIGLVDQDPANGNSLVALDEVQLVFSATGVQSSFGLQYVLPGDGKSHRIVLCAKTSNASDACIILNNTPAHTPSMLIQLFPSNLQVGTNSPRTAAPWL